MAISKPGGGYIVNETSLAASTTTTLADCTPIELTSGTQLIFYFAGTFNASATAGAKVTLWPSYDGTTYVTTAWAGWEWSIAYDTSPGAGSAVVVASDPISPVPKDIKVKIENLDAAYAITSLKIYYNNQTAGSG